MDIQSYEETFAGTSRHLKPPFGRLRNRVINDSQWYLRRLQRAACQIIPSGISLALSMRELVRQGYLYGALVLMRQLAERAMTILYLNTFQKKVEIWTHGWDHKQRPTLAQMFNEIGGSQFPNCGPEMTLLAMPSRKSLTGRIFAIRYVLMQQRGSAFFSA